MMKRKIRVAFIGAGPTTQAHVKAFLDIPEVSIVGVFSRTHKNATEMAQKFGIESVFRTLDDLYRLGQPDLVVVCVYETAKLEIMAQCIPYGVPILAEKPIALNYADSLKILKISLRYNCLVWIAFNRRAYSSTRLAIEKLGRLTKNKRIIEVTDQQDTRIAKNIGHCDDVIKNWMYANSIHLVDYFSIFARGSLESIDIISPWNPSEPGFVAAHLKFSSQDEGIYKAYWNSPGPWSCSISNSDIYIALKPLEQVKWKEVGCRDWTTMAIDEWDTSFKPGFRLQALEAVKAVLGETHRLSDIKNALGSTEIVNKIYEKRQDRL